MDYIEVRKKVVKIISNEVNCNIDKYLDNEKIASDLGCTDIDMIEIYINLEDEFNIMFSIDDYDPYEDHTIKEITMIVLNELN